MPNFFRRGTWQFSTLKPVILHRRGVRAVSAASETRVEALNTVAWTA